MSSLCVIRRNSSNQCYVISKSMCILCTMLYKNRRKHRLQSIFNALLQSYYQLKREFTNNYNVRQLIFFNLPPLDLQDVSLIGTVSSDWSNRCALSIHQFRQLTIKSGENCNFYSDLMVYKRLNAG